MSNQYNRKYSINLQYFDSIDREDKAYFLGLLFADGYVNVKYNRIRLALMEEDKDILEIFRQKLEYSRPIKFCKTSEQHYDSFKHKDTYDLVIDSKYMREQVESLGCTQAKSFTLKFPDWLVDLELKRHFIRGFYDGNGSITINQHRNGAIRVCSTEEFLAPIQSLLKEDLNVNSFLVIHKHMDVNNIRDLGIGGNRQVFKFLEWLYKDSTYYLQRKYDKYQELLKLYKEWYPEYPIFRRKSRR